MNDDIRGRFRPIAPGILLALATLLYGFSLGGAFGAAEGSIKEHLSASAEAVFESAYHGDAGKRDRVLKKSWSYFKRAHLHANGLGTAALAAGLLLAGLGRPSLLARSAALLFGAGALIYASFWMFAGLTAPGLGSTHDAKEALQWMAIPGAGMCILGVLGTGAAFVSAIYGGGSDS